MQDALLCDRYCIVHNVHASQLTLRSWTFNARGLLFVLQCATSINQGRSDQGKSFQLMVMQGKHAGIHSYRYTTSTAVKSLHVYTLTTHHSYQIIHTRPPRPATAFPSSVPTVNTDTSPTRAPRRSNGRTNTHTHVLPLHRVHHNHPDYARLQLPNRYYVYIRHLPSPPCSFPATF